MLEIKLSGVDYTLSSGDLVKIGSGGEGDIFRVKVADQIYALKIYKKVTEEKHQKIDAMLKNAPLDATASINSLSFIQLAWPIAKCFNGGKFVGFLMPYVDYNFSNTLDYYLDPFLYKEKFKYEAFALSYKVEVARNLAGVLKLLHSKGHHFIDFKPQNIRIYDRYHLVSLIDCDGFDVAGVDGARYPAKSFSSEYICPAALKLNLGPDALGEEQDLFVLAVVIFQILNYGIHPFSGIISDGTSLPTTDEKVREGYYPYGVVSSSRIKPIKSSAHTLFPAELRGLFDRAFLPGLSKSPSVDEWIHVLESILAEKKLSKCYTYPTKPDHIHFSGMGCMACYRENVLKSSKFSPKNISANSSYVANTNTSSTLYGQARMPGRASTAKVVSAKDKIPLWKIIFGALALIFAVVYFVANSDSHRYKASNVGASTASPEAINPLGPIIGTWSQGECDKTKYIYTTAASDKIYGFLEVWKSDGSGYVTMIKDVRVVAKDRILLRSYSNDDETVYEEEFERVGDVVKVWRYVKLKPQPEEAVILNGKFIKTGNEVGLLEKCN